jgi:hypothetical protein
MRPLLATTSTEELRIACTRLGEYRVASRKCRTSPVSSVEPLQKQVRRLSFACLIAFGCLVAESAVERVRESFAPFPSDPANQLTSEPLKIGRSYIEELPEGKQACAVYFGTVSSASQLPRLSNSSIGDMYVAADTGRGWIWTVAPWSSEPAWRGPLKGSLGTMPDGPLQVGHTYPLRLPDGRSGVVRYKGAVETGDRLPRVGNKLGDLWTGIEIRACWIWTIRIGASSPEWIDP